MIYTWFRTCRIKFEWNWIYISQILKICKIMQKSCQIMQKIRLCSTSFHCRGKKFISRVLDIVLQIPTVKTQISVGASSPEMLLNTLQNSNTSPYLYIFDSPKLMPIPAQVIIYFISFVSAFDLCQVFWSHNMLLSTYFLVQIVNQNLVSQLQCLVLLN